jgi:hypothetical protein
LGFNSPSCLELELELELIQTQITQKQLLRTEGDCAYVARIAPAKIRGRGGQVPHMTSQRARHMRAVSTLQMHTGRHLTWGTRNPIIAEVKNSLSRHKAPCALPPGKGPGTARDSLSAFRATVKRESPKNRYHASAACGLAASGPLQSSVRHHGR